MGDRDVTRRRFLEAGGACLLLPIVGCGEAARDQPDPPADADAGALSDGGDLVEAQYADASFNPDLDPRPAVVQVGLFADLHHGLEPDAMKRLELFMQEAERRKPTFIIQLGDFTYSNAASNECIELWEQYQGPRYHVLGNHDLDYRAKAEVAALWSMRKSYYSFDHGAYHFVVLDRQHIKAGDAYVPYQKGNYFYFSTVDHADPEQLEWLKADLIASTRPAVVFMHQGLGMPDMLDPPDHPNRILQELFEKVNQTEGEKRVVACFFGHRHVDCYNQVEGIHYVGINSMSYCWLGGTYGGMGHYQDPLYTYIRFAEDVIEVEGLKSQWRSPTPEELGYPYLDRISSVITHRKLRI